MGPLLISDAGGWCMNIAEYSSATLAFDLLRITMGHTEVFDWWSKGGAMFAYDHKVLIGYCSNPALESI